jgi:phosphopantothenoylcysteine decarboxylase/phosphopantothenate--cysteine ligase
MLKHKKILVGVTGGIAAYKLPHFVRLLKKSGAQVQVICTPSALQFVTSETLSVVSENPTLVNFFDEKTGMWNHHVELGLWADAFVIAPCGANTLSKMVQGTCDNLLLTTYMSARCPVFIAPAMDLDMFQQPSVIQNLQILGQRGVNIIDAEIGPLASGLNGKGRMAEPETIFNTLLEFFKPPITQWMNKSIVITAGPTYEAIDPVRFIGNYSSGKMGICLAQKLIELGANVHLVLGPSQENPPQNCEITHVTSAMEMLQATQIAFEKADGLIMAAAVADYRPKQISTSKIKKNQQELTIELVKNPDILKSLSLKKENHQFCVGFALETDHQFENALKKLNEKELNAIVLNSPSHDTGFQSNTNQVKIIGKNGQFVDSQLQSKEEIAVFILDTLNSWIFE